VSAVLRLVPDDRDAPRPILPEPVYYFGRGEPISELTPHDFAAHVQHYGPRPQCRGDDGNALIDAIDEAKLTGRGGAHLPSAIKWRAVRTAAAVSGSVIVGNGAEGEPQSRKDRTLLELRPHLVLDGLVCAAETLGAVRAVIWLHDGGDAVRSSVAYALAERRAARADEPHVEIRSGPDTYLTGESGAVVRALSGGPALPEFRTVPSAARGVGGAPTLVHNIETLVHVAQLARGTHPASALVTICLGDSRVVVEAQTGDLVRDIVTRVVPNSAAVAVLLGGYGGTWCSWSDLAGLCLTEPDLRAHGLSLGAGVLEILQPGTCGLARPPRSPTTSPARALVNAAHACSGCDRSPTPWPALPAAAAAVAKTRIGSPASPPRSVAAERATFPMERYGWSQVHWTPLRLTWPPTPAGAARPSDRVCERAAVARRHRRVRRRGYLCAPRRRAHPGRLLGVPDRGRPAARRRVGTAGQGSRHRVPPQGLVHRIRLGRRGATQDARVRRASRASGRPNATSTKPSSRSRPTVT
jgi:hypothetical protein